jgi:hypothetical protein
MVILFYELPKVTDLRELLISKESGEEGSEVL